MKVVVIGLGAFGHTAAITLAHKGVEVMAIDSNLERVTAIKDLVAHALCLRIAPETPLKSIGLEEMDTAIISIGSDFTQAVIITTIMKKHIGIPSVITRATTNIHQEILYMTGADHVIMPEQEAGAKLALLLYTSKKPF